MTTKRLIKSVEEEDSISEKRLYVREYITNRFNLMRDQMATVHEQDLQIWALKAAHLIGLENFTASRGYLHSFKKENKISSRKITKFYTRLTLSNEAQILSASRQFVSKVNERKLELNISDSNIWNTDQSGFNSELTCNRTLSRTDEKDTLGLIQNANAVTHSYTI